MTEIPLTCDAFLGGALMLHQPAKGQRAGSDAILLAAAVPAEAGDWVAELGSGIGPALLAMARRVPGALCRGIEINGELVTIAARNIRDNGLDAQVEIVIGDVTTRPLPLDPGRFDFVMANPPYFDPARSRVSPHAARAQARSAEPETLRQWLQAAYILLKPRAWLVMIHRAERLDTILRDLAGQFGEVSVFPLWPGGGKPAKRVLLRARKDGVGGMALLPGLELHRPDGAYTEKVDAILRRGQALVF